MTARTMTLALIVSFLSTALLIAEDPIPINVPTQGDGEPGEFIMLGSEIFFRGTDKEHGAELWKSDGTEAGTVLVKDINPTNDSFPDPLIVRDGILYFEALDGINGHELWESDGTEEGTVMVCDLNPSGNGDYQFPSLSNGRIFFTGKSEEGFKLYYLPAPPKDDSGSSGGGCTPGSEPMGMLSIMLLAAAMFMAVIKTQNK